MSVDSTFDVAGGKSAGQWALGPLAEEQARGEAGLFFTEERTGQWDPGRPVVMQC